MLVGTACAESRLGDACRGARNARTKVARVPRACWARDSTRASVCLQAIQGIKAEVPIICTCVGWQEKSLTLQDTSTLNVLHATMMRNV